MGKTGFMVVLNGKPQGFTLAELLIALVILGVIATFTIPKVLSSQQDTKWKSMAKEAAGAMSDAYKNYAASNGVSASTKLESLTPYLNYVKVDSTSVIHDDPGGGGGPLNCSTNTCLILHNGAFMAMHIGKSFGGTASTNAMHFHIDPDGTGVSTSVSIFLYYNGLIRSRSDVLTNTCDNAFCFNPGAGQDPSWFNWN